MNLVVIGSGAREHALTWKLLEHQQPSSKRRVYTIPGNAGCSDSVPIDLKDHRAISDFCRKKDVKLVIIGPEQSLADGLSDHLRQEGICVFGPSQRASKLESSKIYAKEFMQRYGVSTASHWVVSKHQEALDIITELAGNCVLKYDGLAAGKGVVVCASITEAKKALEHLESKYGKNFDLVIEQRLYGREVSIFALCDGKNFALLAPACDHKRVYDHDQGPNTGGMGAVSFPDLIDSKTYSQINTKILQPTLLGLQQESFDYVGFLYFGLMLTDKGPYLLEYNVRLGDPEAAVVLANLQNDLYALIEDCLQQKLDKSHVSVDSQAYVNVVLAAKGYPENVRKGFHLDALEHIDLSETTIFHAGTKHQDHQIVSSGGRVLNLISKGKTCKEARQKIYPQIGKFNSSHFFYRNDIGAVYE